MKGVFFVFLGVLIAASSFAASLPEPLSSAQHFPLFPPQESTMEKQGFFYFKFIGAESDIARARALLPGFGVGYRRLAGNGAADFSFSGLGISEHRNGRYFWTFPKASYYHYLQPNASESFYVGGGLAWGGVRQNDRQRGLFEDREFVGIIPNLTIGYEFAHKASFLGFSELTISQPALAVLRNGAFPGPIAELSVGIGF